MTNLVKKVEVVPARCASVVRHAEYLPSPSQALAISLRSIATMRHNLGLRMNTEATSALRRVTLVANVRIYGNAIKCHIEYCVTTAADLKE